MSGEVGVLVEVLETDDTGGWEDGGANCDVSVDEEPVGELYGLKRQLTSRWVQVC